MSLAGTLLTSRANAQLYKFKSRQPARLRSFGPETHPERKKRASPGMTTVQNVEFD